MAFESLAKVKEFQERLVTRMANMKKRAEKGIGQAIAVAEVNGALAGWGYANERWGEAPKDDPTGLRELKIMGIPADLTAGIGMLGLALPTLRPCSSYCPSAPKNARPSIPMPAVRSAGMPMILSSRRPVGSSLGASPQRSFA